MARLQIGVNACNKGIIFRNDIRYLYTDESKVQQDCHIKTVDCVNEGHVGFINTIKVFLERC